MSTVPSGLLVLCGLPAAGKTSLATWMCHDETFQSVLSSCLQEESSTDSEVEIELVHINFDQIYNDMLHSEQSATSSTPAIDCWSPGAAKSVELWHASRSRALQLVELQLQSLQTHEKNKKGLLLINFHGRETSHFLF